MPRNCSVRESKTVNTIVSPSGERSLCQLDLVRTAWNGDPPGQALPHPLPGHDVGAARRCLSPPGTRLLPGGTYRGGVKPAVSRPLVLPLVYHDPRAHPSRAGRLAVQRTRPSINSDGGADLVHFSECWAAVRIPARRVVSASSRRPPEGSRNPTTTDDYRE